MKTYLSTLIIAAGLFVTTEGSAQNGGMNSMGMGQMGMMGNQMGRSTNRNGMDRGIGVNQYGNGKRKTTAADKVDPIDQSMDHLEKELTLDTFQKTVIKDLLVSNQTEENKVFSQDIPDESKVEKVLDLRKKLDEKIKPLLTKDQVDLFVKMKEKQEKKRS